MRIEEEAGGRREMRIRRCFCEKEKYCSATTCIIIAQQHPCNNHRSFISINIDKIIHFRTVQIEYYMKQRIMYKE